MSSPTPGSPSEITRLGGPGPAFLGACVTGRRPNLLPRGRALEPRLTVEGFQEAKEKERGIESDVEEREWGRHLL